MHGMTLPLAPIATTSFDPYSPMRISQIDFNVERTSSYLVAIHAKGLPNGLSKTWRSLVAQILVDGSTLTTSNPLESWKIYAGSSTNVPPGGWNSDPNFDDSGWGGMSDMVGCAIDDWYYMPTFSWYLNALYGGCAQRFWHHSGCSDTGTHTDLFIRIRMNLISPGELSTPTCPISWDYTATATTTTMTTNASATGTTVNDDPDVPTIPLLSDVQIVAIALSAVIGSLMMAIAYLFVRRYRSMRTRKNMAKGSAMQLRIDASSVLGLELPMYMSSSAMNSPAQSVHKANHVQDMLKLHQRLTSLGAINVSLYNRHVGDSGSPTVTSNGQSSLATSPLADRGVSTLPELVRAYQKKRSLIEDRHSSRQTSESQTRTKTQVTRTDQTLVDGTVQGLEIPGFLQLKEGIDYNIDGEFASGGGGSLYRGCMFSIGLPYLNVIVKRMTSTSLPAFRQEVALMWLFNNCDYTVKLMGFNEAQLAVVMPEYSLGSLKHFIQAGNYDCKVVHSLVLDIAKGLLAMHDCGVVHQDIKPDNVLLDAHPTKRVHAVLADFGISNVVEDKALTVRAFEVKNARGLTIGFAPPEAILRFRNKDLSSVPPLVAKAGDVYSFAMVIFSLLENFRLPQSDPK